MYQLIRNFKKKCKIFFKDDPTTRNGIPSENQMSEFRHNILATSRRNSNITGPPLHRGSIVADHLVVPPLTVNDEKWDFLNFAKWKLKMYVPV